MADYIMYWRRDTAATFKPGENVDHAASQQFSRLHPNDVVWIITTGEHGLRLFARIVVRELLGRLAAQRAFGQDIWKADWHVAGARGSRIARSEIPFDQLGLELEFEGDRDRVVGHPSHHHFRAMRRLKSRSSSLLETVWRQG